MQEHLSDCSPHYASLCVTLREKVVNEEGVESRVGGRRDIECLHLISVTDLLFAVRSMNSNKGLKNND